MGDRTFEIKTEELRGRIPELRAGDRVYLTGTLHTARDAAHKKLFEMLDRGENLPFEIKNGIIYYAGPTPGQNNMPVGSCGPTTSSRMDKFAPRLLDLGLAAMIGKGERAAAVKEAIVRNGAIYFCAVGGAGALIARQIRKAEEIAFPELGCESIKRLEVERLPLTVAVDSQGGDLFLQGRETYKRL